MKYEVRFTSQFKKDLKLAKKQGKNLEKMYAVVDLPMEKCWKQNIAIIV